MLFRVNEKILRRVRRQAWTGSFDGHLSAENQGYLSRCCGYDRPTGTVVIFTRDTGHHTTGWFKNPDYERCLHLSLSFTEPGDLTRRRPRDRALSELWMRAVFGPLYQWAWGEPPVTPEARQLEVWHYRLFCDADWQPIKPRGEVYSTEFTERGWQSASELLGAPAPWSLLRP